MRWVCELVILALLAGCGGPEPIARHDGLPGTLSEYRLEDGTRCLLWTYGGYVGGLSCDFHHPEEPR